MKKILLPLLVFTISFSTAFAVIDNEVLAKREIFKEKRESNWLKLIPNHNKTHFAGSMGILSIGVGWNYGKSVKWETDLFIGYLPKFESDKGSATFTVKQTIIPCRYQINEKWSFEPIRTGLFVNRIFGEDLWTNVPDKYPRKDYYFFATDLRFNIFIGQSIKYYLPRNPIFESASLYYELNTNDLYIISLWDNHAIGLKDILKFSFGIKMEI
jgi:hypothetical protein